MNLETKIQSIIDKHLEAAAAEITDEIRPLLKKRFDYLSKKYGLKKVLIGNGTNYFEFEPNSPYDDVSIYSDGFPRQLEEFRSICDLICDYRQSWCFSDDLE